MSSVLAELENYSIYVILSLRGAEPGFHWGIFVPTNKPQGDVWHAVNRTGGWSLEIKTTSGIPTSISLCLCFKVGTVNAETWAKLKDTLQQVPGNGQPSPNTQEAFTCRVWVKDALLALHNAGVIRLTKAIATIEEEAIMQAEGNRAGVEGGTNGAMVWNRTGFSTTS
ncbi:uncharacterized protein BDR25DRAFT_315166 [Lindgomyces ingoldianus]|uniref:Uncharacterized protein n=1 Tax=Lindgomyces ingoldianus TaxID=673940 RepID=A0ACB6QRC5_9PLEO|nr:uncharacterized protein BDR25DRAFT_315166 [Lindgomyces ingoldianus]KAF2469554.1 hypothetical protein BDR25DRAFT_315166 [Lindgomyces ingoldianus]